MTARSQRNSRRRGLTQSAGCGKKSKRRLAVEALEDRQLLAADGLVGDIAFVPFPNPLPDPFPGFAGTAEGTKWEDANGNGVREPDELGLAGVTIYADQNNNGRLDADEPATRTIKDDPNTRFDETGHYTLSLKRLGQQTIREVVPEGFRQTFPLQANSPLGDEFASVKPSSIDIALEPGEIYERTVSISVLPQCIRAFELEVVAVRGNQMEVPGVEILNHDGLQINGCGGDVSEFNISILVDSPDVSSFEIGFLDVIGGDVIASIPVGLNGGGNSTGGHSIDVQLNQTSTGLDFGNQRSGPQSGGIDGRKWLDTNGNGQQDDREIGLGGVEIYLDQNDNGRPDFREPRTTTEYDIAETDFDEAGLYSFGRLRPGDYTVREVVPHGYQQTYPAPDATVVSSETGKFADGVALDLDVTNVSFTTTGEVAATEIELSVLWPNGCGQIIADQTAHAVIGNTILVETSGHQVGEQCTEALVTQTVTVAVPNLEVGKYSVVATLHEALEDQSMATLGAVGEIQLGPNGSHLVTVEPGLAVSNVNFGNRRTGPANSIHGLKWNDLNGNGRRERGEPGLGGVTIYVDIDSNGELSEGEPSTTTSTGEEGDRGGGPLGSYQLTGLEPGTYMIREVVPEGYRQTYPQEFVFEPWPGIRVPELFAPDGTALRLPNPLGSGAHHITLRPGQDAKGIDFGNQSTTPGAVSGTKWNDLDGNGRRDDNEPGLAGVTIYVDSNFNGVRDAGELGAVTSKDNPDTVANEEGSYQIEGVSSGSLIIREIVPEGFQQTYPNGFGIPPWLETGDPAGIAFVPDIFFEPNAHFVNVQPGQTVAGLDFGNQKIEPGSIRGVKWLDANGNGTREPNEAGLPGVTIFADLNFNGLLDKNEPSATSRTDDPATPDNEAGLYALEQLRPLTNYRIYEVVPAGYVQTFPQNWDIFGPIPVPAPEPIASDVPPELAELRCAAPGCDPTRLLPFFGNFHNVYVGSGQAVDGINFGNQLADDPGVVSGVKWEDANGNGQRDDGDGGLAGVRIYSDLNLNGRLDRNEPSVVTQRDNPDTEVDETGAYSIVLNPGSHLLLEVADRGFTQTYPSTARRVMFPYNLGHSVEVTSGATTADIDFGNQRQSEGGIINGETWFDINANGVLDRGEEPLPGVTVYLDHNDNGRLDEDEPTAITGEDPDVNADLSLAEGHASYFFDVAPGEYTVRQVVPHAYIQTFPNGSIEIAKQSGEKFSGSVIDLKLDAINISTTSPNDAGENITSLVFESVWPSGGTTVTSYVNIFENRIDVELFAFSDDATDAVISEVQTIVPIGTLDFNDYELSVRLYEQLLPGLGGPERPGPLPLVPVDPIPSAETFRLDAVFAYLPGNAHRVSVESGEWVSANFGSIAVPTLQPEPSDSEMGEDPHSDRHEGATPVEFDGDHLGLNSYIDHELDVDLFRFDATTSELAGTVLGGGTAVQWELLDDAGTVQAKSTTDSTLTVATTPGESYFLRVSGAAGPYQIDIQAQPTGGEQPPAERQGDTNGDGKVDFVDFLALSSNYGNEVDDAFADGDFTGDGLVSFDDFLILADGFGI